MDLPFGNEYKSGIWAERALSKNSDERHNRTHHSLLPKARSSEHFESKGDLAGGSKITGFLFDKADKRD